MKATIKPFTTVQPFTVKQLVTENLDRTEDITVNEVKQLASFKGIGDEQVAELVTVIKEFTRIVFDVMAKQERDTPVVNIPTAQTKNIAA